MNKELKELLDCLCFNAYERKHVEIAVGLIIAAFPYAELPKDEMIEYVTKQWD